MFHAMRDIKGTLLYILKRLILMVFTFLVIFFVCFILVRLLPTSNLTGPSKDPETWHLMQVALGREYKDGTEYKPTPVLEQLWNYIKNLFNPSQYQDTEGNWHTTSRWGYSWEIEKLTSPSDLLWNRMPPTLIINIFSFVLSVPLGIGIGIFMALKKNKWEDHVLSIIVMLFISVPSFIYAFLIQYLFGYKWDILPFQLANGTDWFSSEMLKSMILPVLSMSFGSIAGYSRYTRAELTEVLTSDFMLLARTKGLTRAQATIRHAFRNSLVPIFPMILGEILSLLSGSIIIEKIYVVPGVGSLFLESINKYDYDVFQFISVFYILIGLLGGLIVDVSYGLVDPRIRMGGGKDNA